MDFLRRPVKRTLCVPDGSGHVWLLPLTLADLLVIDGETRGPAWQAAQTVFLTVCNESGELLFENVDDVADKMPFAVMVEIAELVSDESEKATALLESPLSD